MTKKKIMFVCTGNSCRSQMAEGFARAVSGEAVEVHSAGMEPRGIHPGAIEAMAEVGIDIRGQSSKSFDPNLASRMDLVVTLCGDARDRCPIFSGPVRHLHWEIPDPARFEGPVEERRRFFARVRDDIRERVAALLGEMPKAGRAEGRTTRDRAVQETESDG